MSELFDLVDRLVEAGDLDGALRALDPAVERLAGARGVEARRELAEAFGRRAMVHALRGDGVASRSDHDAAVATLEGEPELAMDLVLALALRAEHLADEADRDASVIDCARVRELLEAHPDAPALDRAEGWLARAETLERLGASDDALDDLARAVAAFEEAAGAGEDVTALIGLARACGLWVTRLGERGEHRAALPTLDRLVGWLEAAPAEPRVAHALAEAWLARGLTLATRDHPAALADVERAHARFGELASDDPEASAERAAAAQALADLLALSGRHREAVALCDRQLSELDDLQPGDDGDEGELDASLVLAMRAELLATRAAHRTVLGDQEAALSDGELAAELWLELAGDGEGEEEDEDVLAGLADALEAQAIAYSDLCCAASEAVERLGRAIGAAERLTGYEARARLVSLYTNRSYAYLRGRDPERAAADVQRAAAALGEPRGESEQLALALIERNHAAALAAIGRPEPAADACARARELLSGLKGRHDWAQDAFLAEVAAVEARLATRAGAHERALAAITEAIGLLEPLVAHGDRQTEPDLARARGVEARVRLAAGDPQGARVALEAAEPRFRGWLTAGRRFEGDLAETQGVRARALLATGALVEADGTAQAAVDGLVGPLEAGRTDLVPPLLDLLREWLDARLPALHADSAASAQERAAQRRLVERGLGAARAALAAGPPAPDLRRAVAALRAAAGSLLGEDDQLAAELRALERAVRPSRVDKVPEWADLLSRGQYALFTRLVREHWERHGRVVVDVDDGVVRFADAREPALGLGNLVQVCNQCPVDAWPDVIAEHFDALEAAGQEIEAMGEALRDLEQARRYLAVRLYDVQLAADLAGAVVVREDLPGTVSALVLDLPKAIQTVRPEQLGAWGCDLEEAFARGLENVLTQYGEAWRLERVQLEQGLEVLAVGGEDFFVGTQALALDRRPELLGPHGSLVAVPHRHALLAYPIADLGVVRAVEALALIAHGMHREGPGSISPLVYWYSPERGFIALPIERAEDGLVFRPPEPFLDLLQTLRDDED